MTYIQPRASYSPIGRQPFRPGQWQGFKGVSRHTTYIQNNFFGSGYNSGMNFNYGNYNTCCHNDNGGNKWLNILLGIGAGTTLLGGILDLFGIGKKDKADGAEPEKEVRQQTGATETDTTDETDETTEVEEADDAEEVQQAEDTEKPDDVEQPSLDTLKVEKKEVKTSTNYTVKNGDTWANIIMAKYKDENGNPISFTDAKQLWTQLKEECGVSKNADGMPSNIELPNEFKNYKLDINGEVTKNTEMKTEGYKPYDGQGFKTKTSTTYNATGTINGKSIGTISGSGKEVTEQLRAQGFSDKDIKTAMEKGEVKITKQKAE